MASTRQRNGNWYVEFAHPQGCRRSLTLGKATKHQAAEVKRRIERLIVAAQLNEQPDLATLQWLRGVSPKLHRKLSEIGLAVHRPAQTLDELCRSYRASLTCQPPTLRNVDIVSDNLKTFFGQDKLIQDVSPGDADEFKAFLTSAGRQDGEALGQATVSRRCGRSRQIFGFAVRKRWLSSNPFAHISRSSEANRSRDFYVPRELIQRLMQLADREFALILALARFAALRCPSDIITLQWQHVDWHADCFQVHSPKTGFRAVPIFAEVKPYLQAVWEAAPEGADLLFPRHQITGAALTNKLQRMLRSIREVLWPKPWNNMRASCETDLLSLYPALTVVKWVGHSLRISEQHYAQVAKEHHDRAVAAGSAEDLRTPNQAEKSSVNSPVHNGSPRTNMNSKRGRRSS